MVLIPFLLSFRLLPVNSNFRLCVDPAARDYILNTILANYSEDASVLLSTHLIADIERVLDEVVFLKNGEMVLHESVDTIREEHGKSVDMLFREVFAC